MNRMPLAERTIKISSACAVDDDPSTNQANEVLVALQLAVLDLPTTRHLLFSSRGIEAHMSISFDTVISFGDSFSSMCGTCASAPIYGCRSRWTDFAHGLIGNPIFANCSANEGYSYMNYLTDCLADSIDPTTCPTRLYPLAMWGAQAAADLATPDTGLNLNSQMMNWNTYVRPHIAFNKDTTLANFWFGLNDISILQQKGYESSVGSSLTVDNEILRRIASIESSMTALYDGNMRNFLVLNVPPDIDNALALTQQWNKLLASRMSSWYLQHTDAHLYMVDIYALYGQFVARPQDYGFINLQSWCFSDRTTNPALICNSSSSGYLKMDWVHWTSQAHIAIANSIRSALSTPPASPVVDGPESGALRLRLGESGHMLALIIVLSLAHFCIE